MNAMTRQRQKLSLVRSRGRRPPDHRGVGRHTACRRRRLPAVVAAHSESAVAALGDEPPPSPGTGAGAELMVGQSTVLDVGVPIARVSLTSPDVADALVTSSKQLLLNGKTPGAISMFVWDRARRLRRTTSSYSVTLSRLHGTDRKLFPGGVDHRTTARGATSCSPARVSTKDVIDRAVNVAAGFTDKKDDVVTAPADRPSAAHRSGVAARALR